MIARGPFRARMDAPGRRRCTGAAAVAQGAAAPGGEDVGVANWRTNLLRAAAIVPACAALVLAWMLYGPQDPIAALERRAGAARWSEGRSALELAWRPFDPDEKLRDYLPVQGALLERRPTSERALDLALAQFYLWRADTGDLARALDHLERYDDPVALNERALVLLAQQRPIEALDVAIRAVERAPGLPAPLFNRALLMQRLRLDGGAAAAWEDFLQVEPEGPWSDEARQRLIDLRGTLPVAAAPEERFTALQRRIRQLGSKAELEALLGEPDAVILLDQLSEAGERLLHAELAYLRALPPERWPERRALGERYAEEFDRVLAGRSDGRALDRFTTVASPLIAVDFARLALYDAVQRTNLERTRALAERIQLLCARHGCVEPVVLARSDLASVLADVGRFHEADVLLERAAMQLPPHATSRRAEILMKQASVAAEIGALQRASELNKAAVDLLPRGLTGTFASALLNLGVDSNGRGLVRVGLAYIREARRVAERAGVARIVHLANNAEAGALARTGRLDEAARMLEATNFAASETAILRVMQGNRLALARIRLEQGRAREAIALVDAFVASAKDAGTIHDLPDVLFLGARAHFALGEEERALAALRRAASAAREQIELAPDPTAAQAVATEVAPILAEYAVQRAARGDPAAVWTWVGDAELRDLGDDECFVAQLRLDDGGIGSWVADRDGTRFERRTAIRFPLDDGACPPSTRRLTILDRPGSNALALSRMVRLRRHDVAVVTAASPAAAWPDAAVHGNGLVVHSPQPVRLELGLGYLPAAPREASALMRALPGSTELRGEEATPANVIARAGAHDVLHFAVHGVSNRAIRAASFLLLGGELGHLEVVDILSLPLRDRRPVVVLTACRSGAGAGNVEFDGGGLSWAFLEAGARAVVAYQDALEDEGARVFSEAFYAAIAAGAGVSEAFERGVARVREARSAEAAAAFVLSI